MSIYQILHADLSIARAGERYDTKTQAKPGYSSRENKERFSRYLVWWLTVES